MSYNLLVDDVMGYISHPNVLSSWMLVFYHTMQSEVRYCLKHYLLFIYGSLLISLLHSIIFLCLLLSRSPSLTIFWMLILCLLFLPLSQDASPPVVSMDILNSSTSKFVTYVEFFNAIYSSNIIRLHGCFLFSSVVRIYWMVRTGALVDAVGNTHSILVFAQTNVSMQLKPRMEMTL